MATRRVYVYESEIRYLFTAAGDVGRENEKIMRRITRTAIVKAPKRTGHLASSIRNGGALKTGRYHTHGSVYASAKYASFVHDGTQGPITAKRPSRRAIMVKVSPGNQRLKSTGRFRAGKPLLSLPAYGVHGHKTVESVAGQSANPFLTRAARDVVSKYGVFIP